MKITANGLIRIAPNSVKEGDMILALMSNGETEFGIAVKAKHVPGCEVSNRIMLCKKEGQAGHIITDKAGFLVETSFYKIMPWEARFLRTLLDFCEEGRTYEV